MTNRISKLVLTSHLTFSIGWLGAVVVFIALAITGLKSADSQISRACLIAMEISAWFVIVPFSLTSLATGVLQAVATKWGLFKYYWIVVKLFLTLASTLLLLLHMKPISYLASAASNTSFQKSKQAAQLIDLIAKAGGAVLVLVFITALSVYKPWGKIQSRNNDMREEKRNQLGFMQ